MNDITKYIESGILEVYVLGLCTPDETDELNRLIAIYPQISAEINEITEALKQYSLKKEDTVNPSLKTFVLAMIDYTERLKAGEVIKPVPLLTENSKIEDFTEWLNREDMVIPHDFNQAYAKILGATDKAKTALLWIQHFTPPELHDNEFEKFLIVEGTCDIIINKEVHSLIPGNFLSIPLHVVHYVKVTSEQPCKVILQRVAA